MTVNQSSGGQDRLPTRTVVHLMRHGQVDNPRGVLYGRLPGYHLSELGRDMAAMVAQALNGRDITYLVSSPLERAQETVAPISQLLELTPVIDRRVIEAGNQFEGQRFSAAKGGALRNPRTFWMLRNPAKPSWGEPYPEVVARMRAAIDDARERAEGHEALIVSHQLPIWSVRTDFEGGRQLHDPRKRQCTLASLTSIVFADDQPIAVEYAEPAADLLPAASKQSKTFVVGA